MTSSGSTSRSQVVLKWSIRLGSIAVFLVAWQLYGQSANHLLFVPPTSVFASFVALVNSGKLQVNLASTLFTFASGYATAVLIGILIGATMARSKTAETVMDPYVNALFTAPYVALVPLFTLWLGTGFYARFSVVVLSVVFVMIINTFNGFKNVNRSLVETGRAFGAYGVPLYTKVVIPGSLPYIISGLRIGIGRGLIGAIVAELFLQFVGLGYLIEFFSQSFEVANVLAIVLTISLIGLALTEVLKYAERRVADWTLTATGG